MKISINCPSYKRPKVETLDYIPYCKVWVDEGEYESYIKENPNFKDNIISCPKGIQGNVSRIRNYIIDEEFKKGFDVVCIVDDDLKNIEGYEKNKYNNYGYERKIIKSDELLLFIEKYSLLCEELGFKMWGVNCNPDAKAYRHYTPFSTTAIVLGPFSCHIKGDEIRYDESLPLKEDYDLFIQHCNKYRGVLRVNKFHYNCKQSEQAGGCATYRNYINEKAQFELLQNKWGNDIVRKDNSSKKQFDYNPIIKIKIKGV